MPLNPANFPRPPALERISKHLLVKWPSGETIADTRNGFWVLETHHTPSTHCPTHVRKAHADYVSSILYPTLRRKGPPH